MKTQAWRSARSASMLRIVPPRSRCPQGPRLASFWCRWRLVLELLEPALKLFEPVGNSLGKGTFQIFWLRLQPRCPKRALYGLGNRDGRRRVRAGG